MLRRINRFLLWTYRTWQCPWMRTASYVVVNDGSTGGRLSTYYIRPEEQLRQLMVAGCSAVRVFASKDGREVQDARQLAGVRDPWLYYLCAV